MALEPPRGAGSSRRGGRRDRRRRRRPGRDAALRHAVRGRAGSLRRPPLCRTAVRAARGLRAVPRSAAVAPGPQSRPRHAAARARRVRTVGGAMIVLRTLTDTKLTAVHRGAVRASRAWRYALKWYGAPCEPRAF